MKSSHALLAIRICFTIAMATRVGSLSTFAQVEIVNLKSPGTPRAPNLGSAATFLVGEADTGADLNGDGDLEDVLLYVYHPEDNSVVDTGRPEPVTLYGKWCVYREFEGNVGIDVNSDGDLNDVFPLLYDVETGEVSYVGLAVDGDNILPAIGTFLPISVSEFSQGNTDLDGDGEVLSSVLHLYDFETGLITNLGLTPIGGAEGNGNLIAFRALEPNANPVLRRPVFFIHNALTGQTFDTELTAASGGLGSIAAIGGNLVLLSVSESEQAGTDLNGDGDRRDTVAFAYNATDGSLKNLSLACSKAVVDGNIAAFFVDERLQGHSDLNGDGDVTDQVLHVYNAETGTITRLPGSSPQDPLHQRPLVQGGWIAYLRSEDNTIDLNGDGDRTDLSILQAYDTATGHLFNLARSVGDLSYRFSGNYLVFAAYEGSQGADLNGDGDMSDHVVHVFDLSTHRVHNSRLAITDDRIDLLLTSGSIIPILVSEPFQGGTDLNGDGDADDHFVLHLYDAATQSIVNLGLAGGIQRFLLFSPSYTISEHLLLYPVSEALQGNNDLNGDGIISAERGIVHAIKISSIPVAPRDAGEEIEELITVLEQADLNPTFASSSFDRSNLQVLLKSAWLSLLRQLAEVLQTQPEDNATAFASIKIFVRSVSKWAKLGVIRLPLAQDLVSRGIGILDLLAPAGTRIDPAEIER